MNTSASLSSLSVRNGDPLTPSSSFQSHLSHRSRPPARARQSSIALRPFAPLSEPKTYTTLLASAAKKHLVPPPIDPALDVARAPLVFASAASATWMLYVYAFVSLVFFSTAAYSVMDASWKARHLVSAKSQDISDVSYLNDISASTRLDRMTAIQPPLLDFEPLFSRSLADLSKPAACLWADVYDLDWVAPWTTAWDGPISLLVASGTASRAPIHDFLRSPQVNASKVAVHFLQLHPSSLPPPNALINLARLFAPSPQVLLVPGRQGPLPIPKYNASDMPMVITSSSAPVFPYVPLAPVLLPRAHDVWCTERFFARAADAREADWAECAWQLHLDGLRTAVVPAAEALLRPRPSKAPTTVNGLIHRRLAMRFRTETCVLALKRREWLAAAGVDGDIERTEWLQRECRSWVAEGSKARARG